MPQDRHRFLLGVALSAACCVSAPARADMGPSDGGSIEVELRTVAQWVPSFGGPDLEVTATEVVSLDDGTGRLLVATLGGTLRVIDGEGNLLTDPLLTNAQTGVQLPDESGMTGIALHPDFANPGTFGYGKLYTVSPEGAWNNGGVTNTFCDFPITAGITEEHQDVIREWDISAVVGDPEVNALPSITLADSREILRMDQQGPWHNMTDIAFNTAALPGTDDYGQLYAVVGDGWAGAGTAAAPEQPQMLHTIWGNVIRINPDPTAHALVRTSRNSGQPAYSVSPLNPYNGDDVTESTNHPDDGSTEHSLAEIYANGMRSPYRLTFDRETGELYVGDVGQGSREEVSVVEMGKNYGWGRWEGTRFNDGGVQLVGDPDHTGPLFEYHHGVGGTVVGGYVYRGSAIPELQGKYVFLDYGNGGGTAKLFYGVADPNDPDFGQFFSMVLSPEGDTFPGPSGGSALLPDHVFSVGEDGDGELYLVAGEEPRPFMVAGSIGSFPETYVIKITAVDTPYDLVYNAGDGTLTIDTQDEPMISYVIEGGPFNEENLAQFMGGSGIGLDNSLTESNPGTPSTGTFNIGAVMPSHLNEAGFHAWITGTSYMTGIGEPAESFELVYIPAPGDTDGDGDIDDFDLLNAIANFTGSLGSGIGGKTPADGDTDGDGDVDDFDLLTMISGFTGSLPVPSVALPVDGPGLADAADPTDPTDPPATRAQP